MKIHHASIKKAAKFHITMSLEDNEVVATAKDGTRLASGLQGNKVLEDAITKQTGKPAKGNGATRTGRNFGTTPEGDVTRAALKRIAKKAKTAILPSTGKEVSIEERTGRGEGWTKKRGGGFKHIETDEDSEADTWEELCEEQGLIEPEPNIEEIEDDSDADQSRSVVKAKYKALYKPHKDKCGDDVSMQVNKHVSREDPETGEMRVNKKALEKFAKANGCWNPVYAGFVSRTGGWNSGMAVMGVTNRLRGKIRQATKAGEVFEVQWT